MYVSTFICLCDGVEHIYVGICIWVPRKITLIDFILVNASIPDSQECQIYNVLESQFMFWSLCTTCTIGPLAFITLMDSQLISNAKNLIIGLRWMYGKHCTHFQTHPMHQGKCLHSWIFYHKCCRHYNNKISINKVFNKHKNITKILHNLA